MIRLIKDKQKGWFIEVAESFDSFEDALEGDTVAVTAKELVDLYGQLLENMSKVIKEAKEN